MLHLVPQWQSAERHRKLKVMMQDRPDLIKSELAGLAFDSLQQVFRKADIDDMFASVPLSFVKDQEIFIVIDPAAGGPSSDYAIVSLCRQRGIVTVCSAAHAIRYVSLHCCTNWFAGCDVQKNTVTSSLRKSRKKRASFAWFWSSCISFCFIFSSMFSSRKNTATLCACTVASLLT